MDSTYTSVVIIMKSNLKPKLMLIAITVLIATELIIGDSVIAKNCNANNPHGQGGLNCGSAQVTGQVVGTKPGQVGAPSILTANQNSQPKPSAPTPLAPPMRPAEIPAKLAPEPGQPAPPAIPQPAFQPAPTDSKTNIASVINPPAVVQPLSPAVIAPPMRPAEIPAKLAPEPGQPAPPAIPQPPIASAPTVGQTKVVSANPPPQVVPPVITPLVQQPRLVAEPGQPAPPAIPQPPIASAPTVGQTKVASAPTLRPRPIKISPIVIDAQSSSYTSFTPSKENLLLTQDASTAIRNEKMITIVPGRQDPSNYPSFNIDSETASRICIVSGLERRKSIDAYGVVTYQGELPTFRMVTTELADLPAWHPIESGCIISATYKF
jgi:hypothetical protein